MKHRNRWAVLWALVVGILLTHNAYLWLNQRVVPDTDILALLPVQERDPILQQSFTHMVESAQQRLVVLIGTDDWDQAKRAADAYRAVLKQHTDLLQVADGVTESSEVEWLALFQQYRSGLMTPADAAALREKPPQQWVDGALSKLYSPFAGPKVGTWQDDPFGVFGSWLQARAQETPVRPRDGYLSVSDAQRHYVLLPIDLKVPAFSFSARQAVTPLLDQARRAAQNVAPQVAVIAGGAILHAEAAGTQASKEVSTIGIGSLIGIVLLMLLAFHSLKPIGLILLTVVVGFLGALSVSWLLFDRLHLMTLIFGATLIGVAQDYAIYFLCNRRTADADSDQSIDSHLLMKRLLPGLLLTLVTTVIGYLGLALTPFPGLQQMAVFSGLGLIFSWLTVVCWFPLLLRSGSLKNVTLAQRFGASMQHWMIFRRDRRSVVLVLLFVGFAVIGLLHLGVNDDIRLLQTPAPQLVDDQIKLSKLLDAASPVQFFLVRGKSTEAVLQREEELKQKLDQLIEKKIISGYQAMSNWVPSLQAQTAHEKLAQEKLLGQQGALPLLAAKLGEDAAWVEAARAHLLTTPAPLSLDAFLKNPASEPWRHLWLGQVGDSYASIVALRGLERAAFPPLQQVASGLDGVQWVDKVDEISSVLGRYRHYMGWTVLLSYLAVFVLLYPRYRGNAWRVLLPTASASILTLALFGLLGQPLQLFHVLALMLLLGIGVDYGIFLHEKNQRDNHGAWLEVGLSAFSTLLSFGLLGLSSTPALQAFGLTMLIGTLSVWMIVPCFRREQ